MNKTAKAAIIFLAVIAAPVLAWAAFQWNGAAVTVWNGASVSAWNGATVGGGATAYCTGAATCTATTPGQCDALCEDFEGSSYCVGSSGDQKCRNTWSAEGAISTIDWTTAHSGTFACNDKGTNALQISFSSDADIGYYVSAGTDKAISYSQLYINIVSSTVGSNHTAVFWFTLDSAKTQAPYMFGVYNDSGALKLRLLYSDSAMYSTGSTTISTGTWYRIGIMYNRTAGTAEISLNGSAEITISSGVSGASPGLFAVGNAGAFTNGESLVVQYDNIAVDDDTIQGACN